MKNEKQNPLTWKKDAPPPFSVGDTIQFVGDIKNFHKAPLYEITKIYDQSGSWRAVDLLVIDPGFQDSVSLRQAELEKQYIETTVAVSAKFILASKTSSMSKSVSFPKIKSVNVF